MAFRLIRKTSLLSMPCFVPVGLSVSSRGDIQLVFHSQLPAAIMDAACLYVLPRRLGLSKLLSI